MSHGVSNESQKTPAPSSGVGLDDVYYTFFRHKYLLIAGLCLGMAGAFVAKSVTPSMFTSKAKLRVSYVTEARPEVIQPNMQIVGDPTAGLNILNSETEILNSRDVAIKAAELVGPSRILAAYGGGDDTNGAAGLISRGLSVLAPKRSDILIVFFEHRDKSVVQPVLDALIKTYLEKHAEIHLRLQNSVLLHERMDISRTNLTALEHELEQLKQKNQIVDVAETRSIYAKQIDRLTAELLVAKSELAKQTARLGPTEVKDHNMGQTNLALSSVPTEKIEDYTETINRLDVVTKYEKRLISESGFKPAHPWVAGARAEIAEKSQHKADLEKEYPALKQIAATLSTSVSGTNGVSPLQIVRELTSDVAVIEQQLRDVKKEAFDIMRIEPEISALERKVKEEETEYNRLAARAKGLDGGDAKPTNIQPVENPTRPIRSDAKLMKLVGIVFGGCVGMAVVLAVLFDYVLSRTFKRSVDVQRHLHQRAFFTIPHTFWKNRLRLPWQKEEKAVRKRTAQETADNKGENGIAPWNPSHHLRAYTEGLRERLVTYFEVNEVQHKPRLVAITSCDEGAGVTTLASGLAASLSMTGDGNVLLVDMNGGNGAAHSFYKGKPGCGLSESPEPEVEEENAKNENKSMSPMVVKSGAENRLAKVLPDGFNYLVPKLKTSEYDFIVFDMPPVSQTSVTPRLSSQMDIVLMVLESEKTGYQSAQQAALLLRDSRAKVANVLNKCRRYVPSQISQEL